MAHRNCLSFTGETAAAPQRWTDSGRYPAPPKDITGQRFWMKEETESPLDDARRTCTSYY